MSALSKVVKSLTKLKFKAAKHAPEIFMYAGIAGTVGATIYACKKTKNVDPILEEHNEAVEELKAEAEEAEMPMADYRKEMAMIYLKTMIKIGRNYAIPFALFIASVASIMHGHNMLRKWYVDTSVALAAVTNDYNNLYDNLVKEVGEEKAKEIKAGIVTEEIEETYTDAKGKEKVRKTEVKRLGNKGSVYTLRWNCDTADAAVRDSESNYSTLNLLIEQMKNNIATRETGHLFWIEAIEFLFGSAGLKKILDERKENGLPCPMVSGWLYDWKNETNPLVDIEVIKDPEIEEGFLVTMIPQGNISELGYDKKDKIAVA